MNHGPSDTVVQTVAQKRALTRQIHALGRESVPQLGARRIGPVGPGPERK